MDYRWPLRTTNGQCGLQQWPLWATDGQYGMYSGSHYTDVQCGLQTSSAGSRHPLRTVDGQSGLHNCWYGLQTVPWVVVSRAGWGVGGGLPGVGGGVGRGVLGGWGRGWWCPGRVGVWAWVVVGGDPRAAPPLQVCAVKP